MERAAERIPTMHCFQQLFRESTMYLGQPHPAGATALAFRALPGGPPLHEAAAEAEADELVDPVQQARKRAAGLGNDQLDMANEILDDWATSDAHAVARQVTPKSIHERVELAAHISGLKPETAVKWQALEDRIMDAALDLRALELQGPAMEEAAPPWTQSPIAQETLSTLAQSGQRPHCISCLTLQLGLLQHEQLMMAQDIVRAAADHAEPALAARALGGLAMEPSQLVAVARDLGRHIPHWRALDAEVNRVGLKAIKEHSYAQAKLAAKKVPAWPTDDVELQAVNNLYVSRERLIEVDSEHIALAHEIVALAAASNSSRPEVAALHLNWGKLDGRALVEAAARLVGFVPEKQAKWADLDRWTRDLRLEIPVREDFLLMAQRRYNGSRRAHDSRVQRPGEPARQAPVPAEQPVQQLRMGSHPREFADFLASLTDRIGFTSKRKQRFEEERRDLRAACATARPEIRQDLHDKVRRLDQMIWNADLECLKLKQALEIAQTLAKPR